MDKEFKNKPLLVGIKQSTEALRGGKVLKAFVAQDADPLVRKPFEALCASCHVPVTYFDTKQHLGRACGIQVGATCVVVLI